MVGTEKTDGSSITIGITQKHGMFICSRNISKPLMIDKVIGKRDKTLLEYLMFWTKPDLNIYEKVYNNSIFVKTGLPILDKLKREIYTNIIIRGELNGGNAKGSGNKNNPASKEKLNIKVFGMDYWDKDIQEAVRMPHDTVRDTCDTLNIDMVKEYFVREFASREEIETACKKIFEEEKSKGRLIEGIVLRDFDGKYFSAKFMNDEYDSKK